MACFESSQEVCRVYLGGKPDQVWLTYGVSMGPRWSTSPVFGHGFLKKWFVDLLVVSYHYVM